MSDLVLKIQSQTQEPEQESAKSPGLSASAFDMECDCPVLPLRNTALLPGTITPMFVGQPDSIHAVSVALVQEKKIFVVGLTNEAKTENPSGADLLSVGILCNVIQAMATPNNTLRILLEGAARMRATDYQVKDGILTAHLVPMPWTSQASHEDIEAWRRLLLSEFGEYNSLKPKVPDEAINTIVTIDDIGKLIYFVASHLAMDVDKRQTLLNTQDIKEAVFFLLKILANEIDILKLEHDIQKQVQLSVDKNQKEFYLREQLRVIQGKLGQTDSDTEDKVTYERRIKETRMSAEAREKAEKELARLSKMSFMSPEASVVRTYLDWLLDLPWDNRTEENTNIARAGEILDRDHYGMRKVKDRILEFLAVRRHAGADMKGQILCFLGPSGVGKTSLSQSIAEALNRKFANVALGGVHDEAEIRGHRRTYIGALPGRIIQKLVQAKSCNPVILLDEIDKLGKDFQGDPASALLEVLDPRQNSAFTDHYLEVPFDLSEILFITTANVTDTIPKPLFDRMEIIQLPGYVTEEKVQIASHYLMPRNLKEHGLKRSDVKIPVSVLKQIIAQYTHEAGVRNLERAIATILRKITRKVVECKDTGQPLPLPLSVKVRDLKDYLGVPKIYGLTAPKTPERGCVVGLAWSESGGVAMMIESVIMKGRGELVLTGNLGDVMQESAKAAIGYLRSESDALGLSDFDWKAVDIHLHATEGAVPKDGPSAGITIATTILSAVSGRPVRPGIAMTGEISLRGHVLPVGGIREKILAALRQGIHHIILPASNRADVSEVPSEFIQDLTFTYVTDVKAVFDKALEPCGSAR